MKQILNRRQIFNFPTFHNSHLFFSKLRYPMSYLHIAQKNSIAKQVSNILSDGTRRTGRTKSQFNQVYEFELDGQLQRFSSVRGHLFQYELPQECKSWANYDAKKILTRNVGIIKRPGNDMNALIQNLEELAKKSRHLILWLDCDREGESIAYEVIEVCTQANPNLTIQRARFSAVTRPDILQAYHNLVLPNERQANAVKYRMEIDFRLGCSFTRFQTLAFRSRFNSMKEPNVLSYGPCQLPTLSFVVQRYLEIKYFKPENYYFLSAICVINNDTGIDFKWTKKNTRDKVAICLIYKNIYEKCGGQLKGKVLKRSKNIKKRYRPYPLTTVELQKIATDKLRMSSAKVMEIAEKLYTGGYISYPRTQTNSFPKTMNLKNLVDRLRPNNEYGQYVSGLLDNNKFQTPKTGNSDDQAHSPIHPVKNAQPSQLNADQWKVYDLISRHFLACCSKDAVGDQFEVVADIGGEEFKASYLTIRERNFLEIYKFMKWENSTLAGEVPEVFDAIVEIGQEKTKAPPYLSESNLIEIMEKNNIGTDSTIHQHIKTIQDRHYAVKNNNTFKPTSVGVSLIIAYRKLNMKIAECDVRRMMENYMELVARGQTTHDQAAIDTLSFIVPIYDDLNRNKVKWLEEVAKAMEEHKNLSSNIMQLEDNNASNPNRPRQPNQNSNQNPSSVTCFKCGQPGHYANSCPNPPNQQSQQRSVSVPSRNQATNSQRPAQNNNYVSDITCYRCNQKGHFAPNCPNMDQKGKPKNTAKWSKSVDKTNFRGGNDSNSGSQAPKRTYFGNKSNSGSQTSNRPRKPKVCGQCGVEGRHPKNSSCPTQKKNKNVDFL